MRVDRGQPVVDLVLVGSGLGATAIATRLAAAGMSVVLVPGIGRTRSAHVDGGVVTPSVVEEAFGAGAPLGDVVTTRGELRLSEDRRFERGAPIPAGSRRSYRRSALESWAMDQAIRSGALFLEDFVEGKALPMPDGTMMLTSERDDRTLRARTVVLCEGADPRIPLRVRLRPDYGPEDQIHFARTTFHHTEAPVLLSGQWRTSWGMPVYVAVVPQHDGALVATAARIENVMRCGHSSKDALEDFLASQAFASLDLHGERGETGVELIALRRNRHDMAFTHDRMLMSIDASGVIDARRDDRADLTIQAGMLLAAWLLERRAGEDEWDAVAREWIEGVLAPGKAYHDSKATGYIEEDTSRKIGAIPDVLARLMRTRR